MRNTFFDNNFKTIDMKVNIHSITELKEFRDKLTEIINLAEDLGLEVEDIIEPDNKENISDNEIYQIGGGSKNKVRELYSYCIYLIRQYNIYRPKLCAGLTCKSYASISTNVNCTISYTPEDNIINVSNILSGELEMLKHMIEDYFDEIEK